MELGDMKDEIKKISSDVDYTKFICEKINSLELKTSRDIYEEIVDLIKEKNLNKSYPWIVHNLGWIYCDMGDIQKSLELQNEAYEIFENNKDIEGQLCTAIGLLACECMTNNFNSAIEYGLRGIELAESIGNYEKLMAIKGNIASVYMEMEEYEKARDLIEQIEDLPDIGIEHNRIVNLINKSECERNLENIDSALESIEKAYKIAKGTNLSITSVVLDHMGKIYTSKGLYNLADTKFRESVEIAIKSQGTLYLNDTLINWADLDIILKRYEDALEKLKKVEDNIENINSIINIIKLYHLMNLVYKYVGDYTRAYEYLEKYYETKIEYDIKKKNTSIVNLDKAREAEGEKVYKFLYEQTEELYNVGKKITAYLNKEDIFKIIKNEIEKLVKTDIVQIVLYKENENVFEYQLFIEQGEIVNANPIPIEDESFAGYAIKHKKEVFINDFNKEYYKYYNNMEEYLHRIRKIQNSKISKCPQSMIFVPIIVNNRVIGVISIQCYKKYSYTIKDITTLKIISTYMGIALENAKLYKKLEYSANYDVLTKILNRKEALRQIKEIYNCSKWSNSNNYIIMIDIDNFKKINDNYGHQKGDEVILKVAQEIKSSINSKDIVGRYGGEEFIVLLNDYDKSYINVVDLIKSNIEKLHIKSDYNERILVTASLGVSKLDAKNKSLEQIISLSDKALYQAKKTGKNKIVVYSY